MAVSVAVIAHNHNHLTIWKSKPINALTDYWLTLFYGFPAFGNKGLHTVHHDSPGRHWSQSPDAHAKISGTLDPRLNEQSFVWLLVRVFVIGMFSAKARGSSLRLERIERGLRTHDSSTSPAPRTA